MKSPEQDSQLKLKIALEFLQNTNTSVTPCRTATNTVITHTKHGIVKKFITKPISS